MFVSSFLASIERESEREWTRWSIARGKKAGTFPYRFPFQANASSNLNVDIAVMRVRVCYTLLLLTLRYTEYRIRNTAASNFLCSSALFLSLDALLFEHIHSSYLNATQCECHTIVAHGWELAIERECQRVCTVKCPVIS